MKQTIENLEEFYEGLNKFVKEGVYEKRLKIFPVDSDNLLNSLFEGGYPQTSLNIFFGRPGKSAPCIVLEYLKHCKELGIDTSNIVVIKQKH